MTEPTSESSPLPLFKHTARKEWGVGVLIREDEGKRAYLFEDGQERTMANGFHQLMRRVEEPNPSQIAFYERQRGLLAGREKVRSSSARAEGPSFHDQVEKLHKTFSQGLADTKWIASVRGEGEATRTPRHRDALIREAHEQLSASALDALLKSQSYSQVWELVTTVLGHSDLVPASQLKKPKAANAEHVRGLALAVRELLHGTGPYEQRFDGYLNALLPVFGEAPRWELATALSAAFLPKEHICVLPTAFRHQLKVMGSRGVIPARATREAYMRFLTVARLVSNKLAEYGAPPRDLFDVYDFIRVTLGPASKAKG
jgi:hypothetical protein